MKDYKQDNIWLMKGDCLERMKEIESGSVDLTVTSPPYDNLRSYNGNNDQWCDRVWKEVLSELYRVTKNGGVVVWVVGDATVKGSETGTSFRQALWAMECGFNLHDTMIYKKNNVGMYDPRNKRYKSSFEYMFIFTAGRCATYNPIKDLPTKGRRMLSRSNGRTPNGDIRKQKRPSIEMSEYQDRHNVWFYNTGKNVVTKDSIAYTHPAIFPEKLANDHILSWSNEGDVVFDPFMGSGTTGKMAKKLNRNFIGIELDDGYFEVAKERVNKA